MVKDIIIDEFNSSLTMTGISMATSLPELVSDFKAMKEEAKEKAEDLERDRERLEDIKSTIKFLDTINNM
jgi:predicted nuclease with TOPRIM domain